jgi:phosphatidylserine/phosphatidylglycerophosphate/cardiolipin synthase-like enzyme
VQQQIYETIRHIEPRALSGEAVVAPAVSPELLPALRLAEQLSEFPVVGGNHFELLPVYDAAIDRIVADVDAAQQHVHMLFYIFENDAPAPGWPPRSSARGNAALSYAY